MKYVIADLDFFGRDEITMRANSSQMSYYGSKRLDIASEFIYTYSKYAFAISSLGNCFLEAALSARP